MVGNYKVITLCGSTKFKELYLEAQKRLTLEGNIVISVGLFGHSGDDEVWTEGTKAMLVRGNVVFYGRGVQNDVSHPRKHGILRMR